MEFFGLNVEFARLVRGDGKIDKNTPSLLKSFHHPLKQFNLKKFLKRHLPILWHNDRRHPFANCPFQFGRDSLAPLLSRPKGFVG